MHQLQCLDNKAVVDKWIEADVEMLERNLKKDGNKTKTETICRITKLINLK